MSIYILLVVRSITGSTFQVIHPNLVMYMFLLVSIEAYARIKRQGNLVVTQADASPVEVQVQDKRILSKKKSSKTL